MVIKESFETLTYPMHFHTVVSHKVGMSDSFDDLDLICYDLDGLVIIMLEFYLLHRQQLPTLHVHNNVHFAELTLT